MKPVSPLPPGDTITKSDVQHLATKTDLQHVRADIYRVILVQTGVLIGAVFALLRFLG